MLSVSHVIMLEYRFIAALRPASIIDSHAPFTPALTYPLGKT